jgi:hypothetical protein
MKALGRAPGPCRYNGCQDDCGYGTIISYGGTLHDTIRGGIADSVSQGGACRLGTAEGGTGGTRQLRTPEGQRSA